MTRSIFVGGLLMISLLATGCRKGLSTSRDFEVASARFSDLYGEKLDEAFGEPAMSDVEAQLSNVPQESVDYAAAQSLITRIRVGRTAYKAKKTKQESTQSPVIEPSERSSRVAAAPPSSSPTAATPEAPDAGGGQPVAGMPLSEFKTRFGWCFQPGLTVNVQGKGERPTLDLKNIANCRERLPGFAEKLVVTDGDRIYGIVNRAELVKTVKPAPDGG